jgi:hypothetical protein
VNSSEVMVTVAPSVASASKSARASGLMSHAATVVAQVAQAVLAEDILHRVGQRCLDALFVREPVEDTGDHLIEDEQGDGGADEGDDDDILADAVEDFRAVELELEVFGNLAAHILLDLLVSLVRLHVQHAAALV